MGCCYSLGHPFFLGLLMAFSLHGWFKPAATASSQARRAPGLAGLKARASHLLKYLALLAVPTLVASSYFLSQAPAPADWRSSLYLFTLPSYFGFLMLLAGLALMPLCLTRWTARLAPVLGALWLVFLAADVVVFNAYRFHITFIMVQMFFVDFSGMGIPVAMLWGATAAAVLLGALSAALWRAAGAWKPAPRRASLGLAAVLLVFTANQMLHIWASRFERSELSQFNPYLPAYLPIRHQKTGQWMGDTLPSLFPPVEGQGLGAAPKGRLVNYPLKDVACTASEPPHILMLVLESWQADTVNAEVMPRLNQWARDSWRFEQHVAGGSATVPGLFSLMFGLHASYYDAFRAQPQANASYFTDKLHEMGYSNWVFSAGMLDRFALRSLMFPKVPAEQFSYFTQGPVHEDDQRLVQAWAKSLGQEGSQPRFDFLFLNASHFPYTYPEEARRFGPTASNKSAHFVNKDTDPEPLKNDYRNSLHHLDGLIDQVMTTLKRQGRWDKTWVVVLGDHAEEFNENRAGYWGHGSNYTRWQTQTPLIVKPAGRFEPQVIQQTSTHQDVVPTLMTRALGCPEADIAAYANGQLLDRLSARRSTVIGSYVGTAYWSDGTVHDKLLPALRYDWQDFQRKRPEIESARLLELMREESRFFKR